jgi:hypothetical protein
MQDSATHDARGIGRFIALTEWPRYRDEMPGTAERLNARRVIGTSKPGTAERLRVSCSLYARIVEDFWLKGKGAGGHNVGSPHQRNHRVQRRF